MLMMNRHESASLPVDCDAKSNDLLLDDQVMTSNSSVPNDLLPPWSAKSTKSTESGDKKKPTRRRRPPAIPWRKPKDMPRRPLSAYNLFFKAEREALLAGIRGASNSDMLKSKGDGDDDDSANAPILSPSSSKCKTGIGFANLAKTIAAKWKNLDATEKAPFIERAVEEKGRYNVAMIEWRNNQKSQSQNTRGTFVKSTGGFDHGAAAAFSPTKNPLMDQSSQKSSSYPQEFYHAAMSDVEARNADLFYGEKLNSRFTSDREDFIVRLRREQLERQEQLKKYNDNAHSFFSSSQGSETSQQGTTFASSSEYELSSKWGPSLSSRESSSGISLDNHQQNSASLAALALSRSKSMPVIYEGSNKSFASLCANNGNAILDLNGFLSSQHSPTNTAVENALHSAWLTSILQRQERAGQQSICEESTDSTFAAERAQHLSQLQQHLQLQLQLPATMQQQQPSPQPQPQQHYRFAFERNNGQAQISQPSFATELVQSSSNLNSLANQLQSQQQSGQLGNGRTQGNSIGMLSQQLDEDSIAFLANLPFSRNPFE